MRVLGFVFAGAPSGVTSQDARLRGFADLWATHAAVDWALASSTREVTQAFVDAWRTRPGADDGTILGLEPPAVVHHRPRVEVRPDHVAPLLPHVLRELDVTVSRDQVAKALKDVRYDLLWCADPVAMALYGKVRRDVPVLVDVPATTSSAGRGREARRARRWLSFERNAATAAHLVTVPTAAAREVLGVPGAMVVDPTAPGDGRRFLEAATTFSRWSDDSRGMSSS